MDNLRLFLIGFMGSGKSYSGKRLAEKLNIPFLDLDEVIESRAGFSVQEIFEQFGEAHFRELERATLRSMFHEPKGVISCGGGTPCFFDNMEWINEHGVSIYLKTSTSIILERLLPQMAHRPLLKNFSEPELLQFIEQKVEEREKYYLQAQVIYDQQQANEDVTSALEHQLLNIIGH